jgi:AraC-like DNA-binding protein
MVCGSFSFAVPDGLPLLALLPELLRLRGDGAPRGWLEPTLRMLAEEARQRRAGGTIVTSRLTDVLFVQVVRAWLDAQPAPAGNWLAALRDPRIGAALARIHGRPEHPWSVAELAAEVGMSRSPFAARFAALAGDPPLAYLARWRAQVAARLLRETSLALGAVADRVGYESEAAFSRAFRRAMGVAPGAYRRARRAA